MEKMKEIWMKIRKGKIKKESMLILLLGGVLLFFIAIPTSKPTPKNEGTIETTGRPIYDESAYEERIERKLASSLKKVEGVGTVEVMVTIKNSSEKIVEKDRERNQQSIEEIDRDGGTRNTVDQSENESTIFEQEESGQTPYVIKEVSPKLQGVLVIAEGGDNPVIIRNLTEAVQALFDVDTHKIKIMKLNL